MIKKEKPIPIVSPWAKPFWDATAIGILKIQKCSKCDMNIFYPRLYCPSCGSKEIEWIEALGSTSDDDEMQIFTFGTAVLDTFIGKYEIALDYDPTNPGR